MNRRSVLILMVARLLAEHPGGLPLPLVYLAIEEMYNIPKEWKKQIRRTATTTEPQWQNETRFIRQRLVELNLFDKNPPHGIWSLDPAEVYRVDNLEEELGLTVEERRIATPRPPTPTVTRRPLNPGTPRTDTDRDLALKQLLENVSRMPLEQLHTLVIVSAWA